MADRPKYSVNFRIILYICASFIVNVLTAYVTKSGQLNACDGPCTDYAIVITQSFDQIAMKIYQIKRHKDNPTTIPSDIQQLKVDPDSFTIPIQNMTRSLSDSILFKFVTAAKKAIPKEYHCGTPLFFLSFGTKVDQLKKVIVRVMKFMKDDRKHPFLAPSGNSIEKIIGTTEMMYRWIAVNFLAGNLLPSKHNLANDMGLINVNLNMISQIIFPIYLMDSNATESVSVGGKTFLLASGSFTKTGLTRGLRVYIQSLTKGKPSIKSQPSTINLDFPTTMRFLSDADISWNADMKENAHAHVNADTITTRQHIGDLPNATVKATKSVTYLQNVTSEITSPCSPPGTQIQVTDSGREYNITGTGDVENCRQVIQKVILDDYDIPSKSPYMKTRRSVKFYALKEVVPVLESFGCVGCKHIFNAAKIDVAAREYCSSGNIFTNGIWASTIGCLNANFFYMMLTRAYHFTVDTPITVLKSLQDRHHIDKDWALGAMLYKMRLLH